MQIDPTDVRRVNLGMLTSVLIAPEDLEEPDEAWTRESLLAEVAHALNEARDRAEEDLGLINKDKAARAQKA
jgi:hypothetical protein